MTNDHYFIDIKEQIIDNNTIPSNYYSQFDVKRGLRNKDGSGVLAGLSRISSVIGSQMVDYQKISVDGDLQIRDISIFDLCKDLETNKFGYENIVFLLLVGRLPESSELTAFSDVMSQNRLVPTEIIDNVIKGLPSNNMMNKLQSVVAALYGFDVDPDNLDPYLNFCKAVNIIAKMPMAISYSYLSSYVDNPTFVKPESGMSHAESFLYMLRQGQAPSDLERDIFDLSLVLHAEHGIPKQSYTKPEKKSTFGEITLSEPLNSLNRSGPFFSIFKYNCSSSSRPFWAASAFAFSFNIIALGSDLV